MQYKNGAESVHTINLWFVRLNLPWFAVVQIVFEDPRFVSYFRHATPEEELVNLNIGSRPARRNKGGGVETLRAIPWIFAWTQTRLVLPAWLGVGTALNALFKQVCPRRATG